MNQSQATRIVSEMLRRDKDPGDTFAGTLCEKYRRALRFFITRSERVLEPMESGTAYCAETSGVGGLLGATPDVKDHLGTEGGETGSEAGRPTVSAQADKVERRGVVTITYTGDSNRMPVPFMRLRGKWLEKLGGSTGTKVLVQAGRESITLLKRPIEG